MPGSAPPVQQAVQDRMQLSNGLANRMQKSPQAGASSPSNDLRQQQQQQQRGQQGAAKGAETLKYEVQCPHPEVCILVSHFYTQAWRSLSGIIFLASLCHDGQCAQKISGYIKKNELGVLRIQCPK